MTLGNIQPAGLPYQALTQVSPSRTNLLTGLSPGSTGNDNVLVTFTLPAGSFTGSGQEVRITATGSFAANANVKTVKVIWGATTAVAGSAVTGGVTIATTGAAAYNGTGWTLVAQVAKVGIPGSNTQLGTMIGGQASAALGMSVQLPVFPTSAENADIIIAVTGNAATAITDIVINAFEVAGV